MVDSETEKNILIRNDLNYVLSILGKDINTINDSDIRSKKEFSTKIYNFIVKEKPNLQENIIQQILITYHRNFIRFAFSDKLEKLREDFCKILIYLYSNTSNIVKFFPFIFSTLVDKLECRDLEGILHIPEIMRPVVSQKPHKVINLTETSEELRMLYIRLLEAVIFQEYDLDAISFFIEDIVNITRTLCMDPCANISYEACIFAKNFSIKAKDLLLHFNVQLARGLYMALTHKQSKLRLAGLEALEKVLYCSCYKRNVEIIEDLVGFRDPNLVPIKDFYEGSTKFNYFAQLIADPSFQVRKRFYDLLADWLLNLPDRYDHEGRFLPYIMSGLSDEHEEISLQVADTLSQIGLQYEKDNEKDIIEEKQHGIERKWLTHASCDLWYPFPLSKRPYMGSRLIVKKYFRRFIKSMCREFDAVEDYIRKRVSNLFLYSISHIEDYVVEFLDQTLLCFEREFLKRNNKEISENLMKTLRLIGRFCDYEAITNIIYPTLKGDLNSSYADIQRSALICFSIIVKGHIESLGETKDFGIFTGRLKEVFQVLSSPSFLNLDSSTALELIEFLNVFLDEITKKRKYIKNFDEFWDQTDIYFTLIISSFGAISLLDTQGNPTSNFNELEKKLEKINMNFVILIQENYHKDSEKIISVLNKEKPSFMSIKTLEFLERIREYMEKHNITSNTKEYRILFIILKSKLFGIKDSYQIISKILDIFKIIFEKTFNVQVHSETIKLLIDYLYFLGDNVFNETSNQTLINVFICCMKPYSEIPDEKFKFVDALKDPKEKEKKIKTPKMIKSEVREKTLLFLKNNLVKNSLFYEVTLNETNEKASLGKCIIRKLFDLFNNQDLLTTIVHENEKNRLLFIDTLLLFLSKYFMVENSYGKITKIENTSIEISSFLKLLEEYFSFEIFDKNDEVSKKSFTVFNFMLQLYPTSEFFSSISKTYNDILDKKESEFELLKVFAYIDQENKVINTHFKEFKKHFSTVIEFLLDKGVSYKSICENSFKIILEKFPVYVLNDFLKSKNKNQLNRVKLIDTLLSKFLKSR